MARPGLRTRLRGAIRKALRESHPVHISDVPINHNGDQRSIAVTIKPTRSPNTSEDLLFVVFQDVTEAAAQSKPQRRASDSEVVRLLETQLRTTTDDLQGTITELETANEDLTLTNEEAMALNEELQSANEELQTAKEQYQSLSEELSTVNEQLQGKLAELEAANNDLANLLNCTDAATIFLDRELRIRRFNSAATAIANLIPTDVGRPMSHIRLKINDAELLADASRVLHYVAPRDREIEADGGCSWFRRVIPYSTATNVIDGVVLTFHDVTKIRHADRQARLLATVLMDTSDAIIVHDFQGRISTWNRGAERLYGYSEAEALKMGIDRLIPEESHDDMHSVWQRIQRGERVQSWDATRVTRSGRNVDVWITLTALTDSAGKPIAIAKIDRDITERKQAHFRLEEEVGRRTAALAEQQQRLRAILDSASDAIVTIDERGTIESVNSAAERIFGYSAAEMLGQNVKLIIPAPYCADHDGHIARYLQTGEKHIMGVGREVEARRKDGTVFPVELAVSEVEHLKLFTGMIRDITTRKNLEREVVEIALLEQQRIGQDLHDDCGQRLTALALLADSLVESLGESVPADAELALRIEQGLKNAVRQVRNISRGLAHAEVERAGLPAALAELVSRLRETSGMRLTLQADETIQLSDMLQATHLYHIAQEACTNALKHARTDNIHVRLARAGEAIVLEIEDDGIGMVPGSQEGLGLRIMRNRSSVIGAELMIQAVSPRGTLVKCVLKPERRRGPTEK
jgi:PAS domain S-box-containing protein